MLPGLCVSFCNKMMLKMIVKLFNHVFFKFGKVSWNEMFVCSPCADVICCLGMINADLKSVFPISTCNIQSGHVYYEFQKNFILISEHSILSAQMISYVERALISLMGFHHDGIPWEPFQQNCFSVPCVGCRLFHSPNLCYLGPCQAWTVETVSVVVEPSCLMSPTVYVGLRPALLVSSQA